MLYQIKTYIWFILIAMLVGCSTTQAPAATTMVTSTPTIAAALTPTVQSVSVQPPVATLEINGKTQLAGIGSYCWASPAASSQTGCADVAGIPTARQALLAENTPYTATFHLPIETPPDTLGVSVMPAIQETIDGWNGLRLWGTSPGWSGALPLKKDVENIFQESPGLYVIELTASWKGMGNVSYGFLVQVGQESSPHSLSITPVPTLAPTTLKTIYPLTRLGKGNVLDLAISKDGHWLAIGTSLGVYTYDTTSQKEGWFRPLDSSPHSLAFSPDGKQISIGQAGNELPIVDTRTGQTVMTLQGEEGIRGSWSPDGKSILTSGGCDQVLVWDAQTGRVSHTVQPTKCNNVTPGIVNAVWSGDGRIIYVTPGNGYVTAWDVSTFQPLAGYEPHPPEYAFDPGLASSPTQALFAIPNGLSLAIMDGKSGTVVKTLEGKLKDTPLSGSAWSPDGKLIAAWSGDTLLVWDAETGGQVTSLTDYRMPANLVWMPDNQTLAGLFSTDGSLNAVNVFTRKALFSLAGWDGLNGSNSLGWDGDTLLTYDGASEIRWNATSGQMISRRQVSQPAWLSTDYAARSPNGHFIASPNAITNVQSGQETIKLRDASQHDKVAWSADENELVSGNELDITQLVVWDAHTGDVLLRPSLAAGTSSPYLGALAWSPDGKWIAAGGSLMNTDNGSDIGYIAVWDAHTGRQVDLLTTAMVSDRILALAWSPDNRWLAAGSTSSKIFLWDMQSHAPVAILSGHVDQVLGLSWSPSGAMLASSALDGTVLVWRAPW